jgi:hypothetical protein
MVVKELVALLGLDVDEATFAKGEALIEGLKTGLFATVGSLAAVGLGMLELERETANAGNDAYKLAQRLGTTTDAAQELSYAAEATGASAESLQTSMFHMSTALQAAKEGGAEARRALTGLGVSTSALLRMKPDEQFEAIAGGLANIHDQGLKAEKARAIFGRGVIDLLPLINKGADGIRDFREEAHEMGLVLSEETIAEAREWKLQMRQAGEQVDALKYRVGSLVLHGLLRMSRAFRDIRKAFSEWVSAHPDRSLNIIRGVFFGLAAAATVWAVANAAAAATTVAGWAAATAAAVASALATAAAWLSAAAPIVAITFAVALLFIALNDLYHFLKGDMKTVLGDMFGKFGQGGGTNILIFLATWRTQFDRFFEDLEMRALQAGVEMVKNLAKGIGSSFSKGSLSNGAVTLGALALDPLGTMAALMNPVDPKQVMSPSALAPTAGAGVVSNFQANINVQTHPGMSEREVAGQVRSALEDWHHSKVREAIAHVE